MRLTVIVNDPTALKPEQTTTLLITGAVARGHEVWIAGVGELSLSPEDQVRVRARRAEVQDPTALVFALRRTEPAELLLGPGDRVLIRTNPARDAARAWAHGTALELLRVARAGGVTVLSDPDGLARAASKVYLTALPPRFRPHTLISRDPAELRAFLDDAPGDCVLKPLQGTHGRDVFRVRKQDPDNLNQILDVLTRQGFAMAQRFVPEAVEGDTRLLVLQGRILRLGEAVCAVRRVPGGGDFRSNVSAGGHAAPPLIRPVMEEIVAAVGPRLVADGLFLAGLDLIGDVVVEINVFSPGGLQDSGAYAGVDFIPPILEAVEQA
ncbi:MAG: glutathione synthase [Alphaproteobacteria bacterium]|nr:glutathione synthase [Alphaproteobacteria bacterium]